MPQKQAGERKLHFGGLSGVIELRRVFGKFNTIAQEHGQEDKALDEK